MVLSGFALKFLIFSFLKHLIKIPAIINRRCIVIIFKGSIWAGGVKPGELRFEGSGGKAFSVFFDRNGRDHFHRLNHFRKFNSRH